MADPERFCHLLGKHFPAVSPAAPLAVTAVVPWAWLAHRQPPGLGAVPWGNSKAAPAVPDTASSLATKRVIKPQRWCPGDVRHQQAAVLIFLVNRAQRNSSWKWGRAELIPGLLSHCFDSHCSIDSGRLKEFIWGSPHAISDRILTQSVPQQQFAH